MYTVKWYNLSSSSVKVARRESNKNLRMGGLLSDSVFKVGTKRATLILPFASIGSISASAKTNSFLMSIKQLYWEVVSLSRTWLPSEWITWFTGIKEAEGFWRYLCMAGCGSWSRLYEYRTCKLKSTNFTLCHNAISSSTASLRYPKTSTSKSFGSFAWIDFSS